MDAVFFVWVFLEVLFLCDCVSRAGLFEIALLVLCAQAPLKAKACVLPALRDFLYLCALPQYYPVSRSQTSASSLSSQQTRSFFSVFFPFSDISMPVKSKPSSVSFGYLLGLSAFCLTEKGGSLHHPSQAPVVFVFDVYHCLLTLYELGKRHVRTPSQRLKP